MEFYESRIASMQRFVCMIVMFHQMGRRVERFFESISCGLWKYRFDRTHSIMRIATTASPVSGADIRHQMYQMRLLRHVQHSVRVISSAWLEYKKGRDIHQWAQNRSSAEDTECGESQHSGDVCEPEGTNTNALKPHKIRMD